MCFLFVKVCHLTASTTSELTGTDISANQPLTISFQTDRGKKFRVSSFTLHDFIVYVNMVVLVDFVVACLDLSEGTTADKHIGLNGTL